MKNDIYLISCGAFTLLCKKSVNHVREFLQSLLETKKRANASRAGRDSSRSAFREHDSRRSETRTNAFHSFVHNHS